MTACFSVHHRLLTMRLRRDSNLKRPAMTAYVLSLTRIWLCFEFPTSFSAWPKITKTSQFFERWLAINCGMRHQPELARLLPETWQSLGNCKSLAIYTKTGVKNFALQSLFFAIRCHDTIERRLTGSQKKFRYL